MYVVVGVQQDDRSLRWSGFFFPLSPVFIEGSIMGQQRIVKWGRMRSQRGVFKKCLAGLIAFQCALHSFSTVLSTAARSMKVGKHRPH